MHMSCVSGNSGRAVFQIDHCARPIPYEKAKSAVFVNELSENVYNEVLVFWEKMTDKNNGIKFRESVKRQYFEWVENHDGVTHEAKIEARSFANEVFANLTYCDLSDVTLFGKDISQSYSQFQIVDISITNSRGTLIASMFLNFEEKESVGERVSFHSIAKSIR